MQHPFSKSHFRTPEIVQRAQAVLAVTASAFGLTHEKDRPGAPGRERGVGHPAGAGPRAHTRDPRPERTLETTH